MKVRKVSANAPCGMHLQQCSAVLRDTMDTMDSLSAVFATMRHGNPAPRPPCPANTKVPKQWSEQQCSLDKAFIACCNLIKLQNTAEYEGGGRSHVVFLQLAH